MTGPFKAKVAPYFIGMPPEKPGKNGYSITSGKVENASPFSVAYTKILTVFGQSNGSNIDPGLAYSCSQDVLNFNFYNGKFYECADPILGTEYPASANPYGGSFVSRLGDLIVAGGLCDRLIIVNFAIGSTHFAAWLGDKKLSGRIPRCLRIMQQFGLRSDWIIYHGGESDAQLVTNGSETQASVQSAIYEVVEQVRAAGDTQEFSGLDPSPFFLAKSCWLNGLPADFQKVYDAMNAVISTDPNVYAGPTTDDLGVSYRQGDNTHFNTAGLVEVAARWYTVINGHENS